MLSSCFFLNREAEKVENWFKQKSKLGVSDPSKSADNNDVDNDTDIDADTVNEADTDIG